MSLSDFDRMKRVRLPDWGRDGWDNSDRPDAKAGCGLIYQLGRADRDGDGEDAPEPVYRIDRADCEFLDKLIANKIGREHRNAIKDRFYKDKRVAGERVDAAVRALLDAEYVARELGWAA